MMPNSLITLQQIVAVWGVCGGIQDLLLRGDATVIAALLSRAKSNLKESPGGHFLLRQLAAGQNLRCGKVERLVKAVYRCVTARFASIGQLMRCHPHSDPRSWCLP